MVDACAFERTALVKARWVIGEVTQFISPRTIDKVCVAMVPPQDGKPAEPVYRYVCCYCGDYLTRRGSFHSSCVGPPWSEPGRMPTDDRVFFTECCFESIADILRVLRLPTAVEEV